MTNIPILTILQELKSLEIAVKYHLKHQDAESLDNAKKRLKDLSTLLSDLTIVRYSTLNPSFGDKDDLSDIYNNS